MKEVIDDYLNPTLDIVKKAGKGLKMRFGHSVLEALKENDDLRTNADTWVEEFIYKKLKSIYPLHGFDSEEKIKENLDSEYVWILDPIDGTKYFFQGVVPLYSISLALKFNNKLMQGIVYMPQTNQMFYSNAFHDEGSKQNGVDIFCSNIKPIEEMSLVIELPNRNDPEFLINRANDIYLKLQKKVKRIRNFGVGSVTLSYCAMGGFDVYLNMTVTRKHYDFAAGRVIVEQAGGQYLETNSMILAGRRENLNSILELIDH